MKTFYFNTGVKFGTNPYLDETALDSGNGTMVIPFDCEDVPENAIFAFACDNDVPGHENFIKREIHNSKLISKFAYFKPQTS